MSARQGRGKTMKGRYLVEPLNDPFFFMILDGHRGENALKFAEEYIYKNISEAKGKTIETKLKNGLLKTDEDFLADPKFKNDKSGTTALVALVVAKKNELFIANVGDSRAMLMCGGSGEMLFDTEDHKPGKTSEYRRIHHAGSYVINGEIWKPEARLGVSRAIGDRDFKKYVISNPDIHEGFFYKNDILVFASGGVWNVMTSEEVAAFVHKRLSKPGWVVRLQAILARGTGNEIVEEDGNHEQTKLASRKLLDRAYEKGSKDSMSVLIIKLTHNNNKESRDNISVSWSTRLSKSIIASKNIILSLGVVAAMVFYLHRLGYFSSS